MSKKRKQRAGPKRSASPATAGPDLAEGARQDLASGRYREAIAGFKILLKQDGAEQWRDGLAAAYAGRARQLMEKGLLKEARAIWENRAQLGEAVTVDPDHAAVLLQLGEVETVMRLYRDRAAELPAEVAAELRSHLAAHLLAGDLDAVGQLPPDDPLRVQRATAEAALAAYCTGDDQALASALRALPFRSPYRDLVQILKALQRLSSEPQEAGALLARCSRSGGFAGLRRAAELALVPESALADGLKDAGEATRRFALALRGWGEERQALWLEQRKLGAEPAPQALLRQMYRHRERLGEEWVRERGMRLLIEDFPQSGDWPRRCGGEPLSIAERYRVNAWAAERRGDPDDSLTAWIGYAQLLKSDPDAQRPGGDQAVRVALVLRRCDDRMDLLGRAAGNGDRHGLAGTAAEFVEESLAYDPDDPASYRRLIGYYLGEQALKDARRLVEQALARWPQDLGLLTAALDTALATGAFKKATGIARRILALDPINAGARERLVNAHLAHARKQIRGGRQDLAGRELECATDWAREEGLRERCELTRAFLILSEAPQVGREHVRELGEQLGGGIAGAFRIALEASALGQDAASLVKSLRLIRRRVAREDLLSFLQHLRTHLDDAGQVSREVGAVFEKKLKAAAAVQLSFQEAHAACETLRRAELDEARAAFAKAALKRWQGAPIFELHAFEATYRGDYRRVSVPALERLDRAIERAHAEGDRRTLVRLEALLREADGFAFGPPPMEWRDDAEDEFPGRDELRVLINLLGPAKVLEQLGVSAKERKRFKQLEREVGTEALIDALAAMLEETLHDVGPPMDFPFPLRPRPEKSPAKKSSQDKEAPDDPNAPRQLDLF